AVSTARRARTVRRSADPGPAPTRWTWPSFASGGMALLRRNMGGEHPGDLRPAGAAVGSGAGGGGDRVHRGAAPGDGGVDLLGADLQAGADKRTLVHGRAGGAAEEQGASRLGVELVAREKLHQPVARRQAAGAGGEEDLLDAPVGEP